MTNNLFFIIFSAFSCYSITKKSVLKTIAISVINDLSTDQRVARTCSTLHELRFNVVLIGRKLPNSLQISRPYRIKRFIFFINKGPLFYFLFNLRLFFYLLFKKIDVLYANDLDTLLANTLISILKRKPLIYDSHEYFLGVPEIQNRKIVKRIWSIIENFCFKHVDNFITVNNSIAEIYSKSFNHKIEVIRNVPIQIEIDDNITRSDLNIPESDFIMIMQGAGINIDRGYEEAVLSLQYLDNVLLLIIGSGDVIDKLKDIAKKQNLNKKIKFISKLPYSEMMKYTAVSDVGLTLDKDLNINYKYSLPNKLFDYIMAGIPVIASNLIEVKSIIETYQIGIVIDEITPQNIADSIKQLINNKEYTNQCKTNSKNASKKLNWENEKLILENIIHQYV